MNLFEWTKNNKNWHITCPLCGKPIVLNPPTNGLGLLKNKLKCSKLCSFEIDTSWIWYKIKASQLVEQLLMRVPSFDLKKAWEWVNIFKYSNPTYQISQEVERKSSEQELKRILGNPNWIKGNVLSIGCNSGQELLVLSDYEYIDSIVCVDISKTILDSAIRKNHKILMEQHKSSKNFNVCYCESFAENLPDKLKCFKVEKSSENNYIRTDELFEYDKKFDLVLVLKLFQSSYFDVLKLRKTLIGISKQLGQGGRLIISLAKATGYISEDQDVEVDSNNEIRDPKVNFVSGLYQPKGFVDSLNKLNNIVQEVLFMGEYKDVSVYYGDEKSYEYYISCIKI